MNKGMDVTEEVKVKNWGGVDGADSWPKEHGIWGSFEIICTNHSFTFFWVCKIPGTLGSRGVRWVKGQVELSSNRAKGYWWRLWAPHDAQLVSNPSPSCIICVIVGDLFLPKACFLAWTWSQKQSVQVMCLAHSLAYELPHKTGDHGWRVILGSLPCGSPINHPCSFLLWDHHLLNLLSGDVGSKKKQ